MPKLLIYTLILSFSLVGCAGKWPKSKEWRLQTLEENFLELKNNQKNTQTKLVQLEKRLSDVENNLEEIKQKQEESQIQQTEIQEKDAEQPSQQDIIPESENKNGAQVEDEVSKDNQVTKKINSEPEKQEHKNDEQALYKRALDLIWQNKPEQARKLLLDFKNNYPHSKLMPNVLYWIGETYYSQEQFAKSILNFKQVMQTFPKHPKAVHALLKIAYAYENLNDKSNALFYLKVLVQDYPNSDVAARARKKIKEIGGK